MPTGAPLAQELRCPSDPETGTNVQTAVPISALGPEGKGCRDPAHLRKTVKSPLVTASGGGKEALPRLTTRPQARLANEHAGYLGDGVIDGQCVVGRARSLDCFYPIELKAGPWNGLSPTNRRE